MTNNQNKRTKTRFSREAIWTFIGLFALSAISAAYILNFRIKMKKYQVTPQQQEETLQDEKAFEKAQKTKGKNQ